MEPDAVLRTLRSISLSTVVKNFCKCKESLQSLPRTLLFDVYKELHHQNQLCLLSNEFCDLHVFGRMLKLPGRRPALHQSFQAIRDHGVKISRVLSTSYQQKVSIAMEENSADRHELMFLGFRLGGFMMDAGWNKDSAETYSSCYQMCIFIGDLEKAFHCCTKLLHVYNANCMYREAESQFLEAKDLFQRLHQVKPHLKINLASLFAEYGAYHFAKSEYDKAYRWSIEALKMLKQPGLLSKMTIIDVLRLASKACVVKRQFTAAEILVQHAVVLTRDTFGPDHPKYSSTLLDYGFYLLNVDNVCQSQKIYQTALNIRQSAFGGQNLHVAIAHEDLAYASYVHHYSTGRFEESRCHADAAINILSKILPSDHLLLASSNRVKALILEEIAIDSTNDEEQKNLLEESHHLHLQSLELSKKAFGERNVQTAKHYGNLGRLYQSMELYEKAEEMHLKAITIKEELLGPEDYEVALSVGHLASLYNYDLKQYGKAEELYLRSISIANRLFGEGYSGLEYDYRGLIKLYSKTGDFEKVLEYDNILNQWSLIREEKYANQQLQNFVAPICKSGSTAEIELASTGSVIDSFFSKIREDETNRVEKRLEQVFVPSRTKSDIAFGGALPSRGPPRENDHRNVGDGTVFHSSVSVPQDVPSCSNTSMLTTPSGGNYAQYDWDMLQDLELFLVIPRHKIKKRKLSKLKKE